MEANSSAGGQGSPPATRGRPCRMDCSGSFMAITPCVLQVRKSTAERP
ncbi:hypothetical protein JOE62_000176 [Glutamicibacter nicotianae]|nr:hypothetical protein [Glutamicibacter nicotianae]